MNTYIDISRVCDTIIRNCEMSKNVPQLDIMYIATNLKELALHCKNLETHIQALEASNRLK